MIAPITNMTAATRAAIASFRMLGRRPAAEAGRHRTSTVWLGWVAMSAPRRSLVAGSALAVAAGLATGARLARAIAIDCGLGRGGATGALAGAGRAGNVASARVAGSGVASARVAGDGMASARVDGSRGRVTGGVAGA